MERKPYPSVEGSKIFVKLYDSLRIRKHKPEEFYDDSILREVVLPQSSVVRSLVIHSCDMLLDLFLKLPVLLMNGSKRHETFRLSELTVPSTIQILFETDYSFWILPNPMGKTQ